MTRRPARIPCPTCGWWHASDDAHAINRFAVGGPTAYRAAYLGAPLRASRADAELDACRHRARQNATTYANPGGRA